ncbi:DUF3016 domain-containing protein [Xanthobacter sp. AM11]|uniref:DUF3016 domain-containing protein n=1 Tax=Xanthobacter sp. AM11 TaxID=3380643 RepID=UPI0039BFBE93
MRCARAWTCDAGVLRRPGAAVPLPPLVLVLAMLFAGPAAAGIQLRFVDPEHYSDTDFRSPAVRAGIVADFTAFFARLGARDLKPGQDLRLEVLDMELAGEYEPWRRSGWGDVRILRDITPPRFKLRYTLCQKGKVVVAATETVTDINYLMNPSGRGSDRFSFEKAMLEDWFRARFVRLEPPRVLYP